MLTDLGHRVELLDGDEYRRHLCRDLGFSRADRIENIRRLGFVGQAFARQGIIAILAAINPYREARQALQTGSDRVRTVYVACPLNVLEQRDPKSLYHRARLPESHPEHIPHFTGISDPYEAPEHPDLILHTDRESPEESAVKLADFILRELPAAPGTAAPRALFIGRWQPFHNGHKWLIDQKLKAGIPVLLAVRDRPQDQDNPFTTAQTIRMIRKVYQDQPVTVMALPDIESVNFGRGVGYEVNRFDPPAEVGAISATRIRDGVQKGDDAWKAFVDERLHDDLIAFWTTG